MGIAVPWPAGVFAGLGFGVFIATFAFCFGTLRVCDESTHLAVRFGPLPLFRTLIPYSKITSVEPSRSNFIDGWGIHWIPGRGMIYNLWGFDCVKIQMGDKCVRAGTDDTAGLMSFLKEKKKTR